MKTVYVLGTYGSRESWEIGEVPREVHRFVSLGRQAELV